MTGRRYRARVGSSVAKVFALVAFVLFATAATYPKGVDVSNWQGSSIDWLQVAGGGYTFAFAKASENTTFTDVTYAVNRGGAKTSGVRLGAYHFARPAGSTDALATADAIAEADHFVDVAQVNVGDLPPVLDLEVTGGLSPARLVVWTTAFLDQVAARTGVRALIYASPSFWKTQLSDTPAFALAGSRLWIAHWTKNAAPQVPAANWNGAGWSFWQWSNCVKVPGIVANCVDANRANASSAGTFAVRAFPTGALTAATPPAIVGAARAGVRLAATAGSWTGARPATFSYQWQTCTAPTACTPIPGASLETYTPGGADVGRTLNVVVTAKAGSISGAATSPNTAAVAAANGVAVPLATTPPLVAGTLQVGQPLLASAGAWNGNPSRFAYQWQRCDALGAACAPIAGATTQTYTVTPGDLALTLSVVVTATNAGGSVTASATPTTPVQPAPVPAPVVGPLAAVAGQAGAVVTAGASATVTWQPGAVPVGSVVSLDELPRSLRLMVTPSATLPWPAAIAYATTDRVVGFSTDGRIWAPVPSLTAAALPAGVLVGLFEGTIYTRRAGQFRLFVPGLWGDPTKVSKFAPRLRRVAPIEVTTLRRGVHVVSTRLMSPSQVLVLPSRRRLLRAGTFPVKVRVPPGKRSVKIVAIDPYGRRGAFTLSFRAP